MYTREIYNFSSLFFGRYSHLWSSRLGFLLWRAFSKFWWKTMLLHIECTVVGLLLREQGSALLMGGDIVWYIASDDSWLISYECEIKNAIDIQILQGRWLVCGSFLMFYAFIYWRHLCTNDWPETDLNYFGIPDCRMLWPPSSVTGLPQKEHTSSEAEKTKWTSANDRVD